MDQKTIDDLSDLLQGRNSEHREYPFGHPKYRPTEGSLLSYIPGTETTLTVDFGTSSEAKRFFDLFQTLNRETRDITIEHLSKMGKVVMPYATQSKLD